MNKKEISSIQKIFGKKKKEHQEVRPWTDEKREKFIAEWKKRFL